MNDTLDIFFPFQRSSVHYEWKILPFVLSDKLVYIEKINTVTMIPGPRPVHGIPRDVISWTWSPCRPDMTSRATVKADNWVTVSDRSACYTNAWHNNYAPTDLLLACRTSHTTDFFGPHFRNFSFPFSSFLL